MTATKTNKKQLATHKNGQEDQNISLKILWSIFMAKRWWFLISFLFFMGTAAVYLRLTHKTYLMTSKILIKDKDERSKLLSKKNMLTDIGFANNSDGFDNELEVIKSDNLASIVVRDLKLYTQYYAKSRIRYKEFYGKYSPWLVDIAPEIIDTLKTPIILTLEWMEGGSVDARLTYNLTEVRETIKQFPTSIQYAKEGKVDISFNDSIYEQEGFELNQKVKVVISPLELSTMNFNHRLEVAPTSKTTTVALMQFKDNLPERGIDYLKHLTEVYNNDATIDYNMEAQQAADFINQRLQLISSELEDTEGSLESYKRGNKIVDYQNDIRMSTTQKFQYENRIAEAQTQYNLVCDLVDYVNNPANNLKTVPSNIGLADPTMAKSIEEYNTIAIEYQRLKRNTSEESPILKQAENVANDHMNSIKASLNTLKKQYGIRLGDMQRQAGKYNQNLNTSPTKERALGEIRRQQEVKSGLFIMLLQKREENLIQLASTVYKAKEIEKPVCQGYISPKSSNIYLFALCLALVCPFLLVYGINFFKIRITTREDIEEYTDIPLFGFVPFVKALVGGKRTIVIEENRNSIMMEAYRQLRSTLPFVMSPDDKVILFTSCVAGEGKTSVACNLGTSIAFTGKRVLLIGLDIRKPRLAGLFNLDDEAHGISNYLTRNKDDFDYLKSIIQHTGVSKKLDIIPAGTIPPNPAELISRPNLQTALEYLKGLYDFIILDTAPLGLVSDTLSLTKLADVTFFVMRANYSLKADVQVVNNYKKQGVFNNINIILNAVKLGQQDFTAKKYGSVAYGIYRSYGNGYGQGGGSYGYGYGYGENNKLEEV